MPVLIETLTQPGPQDRADLARIYAEAPAALLAPWSRADDLLEAGLAGQTLLAARFNGRLLGAALLLQQPEGWRLAHLCVRALTRRRGVGRRLAECAARQAAAAGQPLSLQAPAGLAGAAAFAHALQLPLVSG